MDSIGWLMLIIGGAKLLMSSMFGGNIFGSGGIIDGLAVIFVIVGIVFITLQKVETQKEIALQNAEREAINLSLQKSNDIDLIVKLLDSKNSYFADKALDSLPVYQNNHPDEQRIALLLKNTSPNARIKAILALLELSITQKNKNALITVLSVLLDTPEYYYPAKGKWREYKNEEYIRVIQMIVDTGFTDITQSFFKETAIKSIFSILGLLIIGNPEENEAPISFALEKLKRNKDLLPFLSIVSDLLAQKCPTEEALPILNSYLLSIPAKDNDYNNLNLVKSIEWILRNRTVSDRLLKSIEQIGNIVIYHEPGGSGADYEGNYYSSDGETLYLLEYLHIEPSKDEVVPINKPRIPF